MTFTEIVTEIADRLNLTSSTATTRLGRAVNRLYREVGTSIGLSFVRQTNTSKVVSIGNPEVTFTATEKVLQVWTIDEDGNPTILDEVMLPELREAITPSSDEPKRWALRSVASNTVTIRLDRSPATAYTIYAEVIAEVTDLSGSDAPTFPESFHDILVDGVLKDEYRKLEKIQLARDSEASFQRRLSDLRMFIAKSQLLSIRQGEKGVSDFQRTSSGGTSSLGSTALTITSLWTFDRDPGAPFAVTSGSAVVTNLDADTVDGLHAADIITEPGGSDTQVQFNDGGSAFGGDADLTYNKTTGRLTMGALTVNGHAFTVSGAPTLNNWFDQSVKVAASPTFIGLTLSGAIATPTTITTSGNVTVGGLLDVDGFGTHTINAGGAGNQSLQIGNSTAGTGNTAGIALLNDEGAHAELRVNSSTYTPSGIQAASATTLEAARAGGLSIATTHASGTIRFYSGGSTLRWTVGTAGHITPNGGNTYDIGDGTNYARALYGLTLNSGSATDLSLNANGANRDVIVKVDATEVARFVGATKALALAGPTTANAARLLADKASIANDATKAFFGGEEGILFIMAQDGTAAAIFSCNGGTTFEVSDPSGIFSASVDTGGSWNVYVSGGNVTVQNKTGTERNVSAMFFRT